MWSLTRLRPDAGAAGDLATADSLPERRERTHVSQDGRWWWNGRRWLATATEDGLWRWDGERWRSTIELAGARPWDLAGTLTLLAEDRYARAARILVERPGEWWPRGELRALVERARRGGRWVPRDRTPDGAGGPPLAGLLRRLSGRGGGARGGERPDAVVDPEAERRALLLRIGRAAPSPTVKEADELLAVARLLEARAAELSGGLAAIDEAERARGRAVVAAQRALVEAEDSRRRALAEGRRALDEAEERHAEARRAAVERLRLAIAPPPGEPLADVGPLRAFATAIETPDGRLAAEGTRATAGRAASLWTRRRAAVTDLLAVGTPAAEDLFDALQEGRDGWYVLLEGRSRTVLWPVPEGRVAAARAFAAAVNRQAKRAATPAPERDAACGEALEAARAVCARPPLELAREAVRRQEADPALQRPITEARERLREARADPPELAAAKAQVMAAHRALTTPPTPLG
jgi:hypothetical protein